MTRAVPPGKVSRNEKASACKPVKMPIVRSDDTSTTISCGWVDRHPRVKIREERAEKHLNKRHGGMGLWL